MGIDFLKRIGRATAVVGVLVFAFVSVYYDLNFGLGLLIGCLWGIANFAALAAFLTGVVTPARIHRRRALVLALVKFPVLYAAGFLILCTHRFEPTALLTGFSLLFLVTLLKALGRAYLHLDERSASAQPRPRGGSRAALSVHS